MLLQLVKGPTRLPLHLDEVKAHLRIDAADDDALVQGLVRAATDFVETHTHRRLVAQTWALVQDCFTGTEIELPYAPLLDVESVSYADSSGVSQTWASSEYVADTYQEPGRLYLAYGKSWPSTRGYTNDVKTQYRVGYLVPFTANDTTDVLTLSGYPFVNGDVVRAWNSGGALPGPLATMTDYYVISVTGSTCKLSTSKDGSAVDLSSAGSGYNYLYYGRLGLEQLQELWLAVEMLTGHWYEHREAVSEGTRLEQTPLAVQRLIWSTAVF